MAFSREVDEGLDLPAPQELEDFRAIADVFNDQFAFALAGTASHSIEISPMARIGQRVKNDDVPSLGDLLAHKGAPDESGTPGDEERFRRECSHLHGIL